LFDNGEEGDREKYRVSETLVYNNEGNYGFYAV